MSEIQPHSVFRRVWQVSHELPGEEQVAFFDENQSELVVVNAIGNAVWELLDGERSVEGIAQVLSEEIEGAPDRACVLEEVVAFLSELRKRAAIEEA